jgi:hypothetical protein
MELTFHVAILTPPRYRPADIVGAGRTPPRSRKTTVQAQKK